MKKGKETVLIVDDQSINRRILCKSVATEYAVLEAESGKAAFNLLTQYGDDVVAILLDIVTPMMDGFEFLEQLPHTKFAHLPVIVITGRDEASNERRALDLGAWDFVVIPCQPSILIRRLRNAIARSQLTLLDQLRHMAEHDSLTGLYNRMNFMKETRCMLNAHREQPFALVRFDIDGFRLFNSFWGEAEGDRFLQFAGNALQRMAQKEPICTYGRIDADIFALCEPFDEVHLRTQVDTLHNELASFKREYLIESSFGIYVIEDTNLPVETMYMLASLAAKRCKNKYMLPLCFYEPKMKSTLLREQTIINEMAPALASGQFVPYFQPKYDLQSGQPYGAEALVRWKHPKYGIISPAHFIPIFERNGFIGKLDYYMWETVCKILRRWIDEGYSPTPISVNVSRVNMYNPNIISLLVQLVQTYKISPQLLNLELTESAYMDDPETMIKTVKALQQAGFSIMMDDFGSGYSSLNTLKDIPVDFLKVDMGFLSAPLGDGRSERILASIIRMAGWLETPVIVEGVETQQQIDFLRSIGCGYVQGYYYAKPMPLEEYDALIRTVPQTPITLPVDNSTEVINTIWSKSPQIQLLFSSIQQPVGIYEYDGNEFNLLRVNAAFANCFDCGENGLPHKHAFLGHTTPDTIERLKNSFQQAEQTEGTTSLEYMYLTDHGDPCWYRMDLEYWGQNQNKSLYFATFTDVTENKRLMQTLTECYCHLQHLNQKRSKLLIVDDSESSRAILRLTFDKQYEILEACNGEEGLRLLRAFHTEIAVVLLDLVMPVLDGKGFLLQKNVDSEMKPIPVVMISSDDNVYNQIHLLEMGINDYITKPFVPELMKRRVENVLEYNTRFQMLMEEYREHLPPIKLPSPTHVP